MNLLVSKTIILFLCLVPLLYSAWQVVLLQQGEPNSLGADPGEALVHFHGEWALRLLVLTLLVSPIQELTPLKRIVRFRRMLGLFAFFYAAIHLTAYSVFLLELDVFALWTDIEKRPYITVGFAAWLLMLPLALTSTDAMVRWLGQRWKMLHRAIYVVALLAVVHIFWLAKASYLEPVIYASIVFAALLYRYFSGKKRLFQRGVSTVS